MKLKPFTQITVNEINFVISDEEIKDEEINILVMQVHEKIIYKLSFVDLKNGKLINVKLLK